VLTAPEDNAVVQQVIDKVATLTAARPVYTK